MKICNKCKKFKEHSIRVLPSGKEILQGQCKDCQKIYKDDHYRNNKQQYQNKLKARRDSMKRFLVSVKNFPCTDCKLLWPSYVMHFDHLDSKTKVDNISSIIRNRCSWKVLIAEIMKCDLVCATCHAIRTHDRGYATK